MSPTTSSGTARRLHSSRSRRLRGPAGLAAALALGVALSGCSAFGGSGGTSSYTGTPVPAGAPRAGQQSAAPGASGAAAAPGASGAPGAAAQASQKPYVAAAAKGACSPQKFVQSAALVGGAITTYITKPLSAASVSETATARAASAAGYAAKQLSRGVKAVESCPAAKALAGVSKQNVTALQHLATALRAGAPDPQKVNAVAALFGDVTAPGLAAQAHHHPEDAGGLAAHHPLTRLDGERAQSKTGPWVRVRLSSKNPGVPATSRQPSQAWPRPRPSAPA